jgi:hypothetical protein
MADNPSDAYNGCCTGCGRVFNLADLKHMAVGDGWQRYLRVIDRHGQERVVSFDDFLPHSMTPISDSSYASERIERLESAKQA